VPLMPSLSSSRFFSTPSSSSSKPLYTAKAHTTGGRNGSSSSDDGQLKVTLASPKQMGGNGQGTNPEQLFASGYAACFLGALGLAARNAGKTLPQDASIDSEVTLNKDTSKGGSLSLSVILNVSTPGWDRSQAQQLVNAAHDICPYSKAIKNSVPVTLNVVS